MEIWGRLLRNQGFGENYGPGTSEIMRYKFAVFKALSRSYVEKAKFRM